MTSPTMRQALGAKDSAKNKASPALKEHLQGQYFPTEGSCRLSKTTMPFNRRRLTALRSTVYNENLLTQNAYGVPIDGSSIYNQLPGVILLKFLFHSAEIPLQVSYEGYVAKLLYT